MAVICQLQSRSLDESAPLPESGATDSLTQALDTMAQDRVINGTSDGRLYRVLAGEAYSWNVLLIEDQLGERFRIDTRSRVVSPITDDEAQQLIESRAFRPWAGSRLWASLNELPLSHAPVTRFEPTGPTIEPQDSPDGLADG